MQLQMQGMDGGRFETRQVQEIYRFFETSRPAVEPTPSPIRWVPEFLLVGKPARMCS